MAAIMSARLSNMSTSVYSGVVNVTNKMGIPPDLLPDTRSPTNIGALVLVSVLTFVWGVLMRPKIAPNAPKFWAKYDIPFFGPMRFFTNRTEYMLEGIKESPTGSFSFYVGKRHVIALGGAEGRKAFYEGKTSFYEGFAELFSGEKAPFPNEEKFHAALAQMLANRVRASQFTKNMASLTGDVRSMIDSLITSPPLPTTSSSSSSSQWSVFNPFETFRETVCNLTMRTVGAIDIARDPALAKKSLHLLSEFEQAVSPSRFVFPWLLTPVHILKRYYGGRMLLLWTRIVEKRRKSGVREDDAIQYLLDQGLSTQNIVFTELTAIYAAQTASSVNAAWIQVQCCMNPSWFKRVREEVDGVVAKYRTSASQSPADVLDTLSAFEQWEKEFPTVILTIEESVRLGTPGALLRKNTSGRDMPIGNTGEVIPHGSFATYVPDEQHLNPEVYPDPERFDPTRFERGEDKKHQYAWVGWGGGRHPCLGQKFAKLQMTLITAYFVSMFEFELSDERGNKLSEPVEYVDRNLLFSTRPKRTTHLRYKLRKFD